MRRKKESNSAKDRILAKALELFYKQGYLATGINQVIAESGVAKNTFYYYFPSKDALCVSYLQAMDKHWIEGINSKINRHKKPLEKLFAPLEFLKTWNENNDFRGCPFLNMVSEITDSKTKIRNEVIYHKEGFKTIINELVKNLRDSEKKYKDIDVKSIAEAYYIIAEGAIVVSQNYHNSKPFVIGRKNIERLLNP